MQKMPQSKAVNIKNAKNVQISIDTSMGLILAQIWTVQMPTTAGRFVSLVERGFYDGMFFHRVVKDGLLQTGCPHSVESLKNPAPTNPAHKLVGTGKAPEGYIPDEFLEDAKNSNLRGTLAFANEGRVDTGSCQFFINLADNTYLDWFDPKNSNKNPVFGKIIDGMDVAEKIGTVKTTGRLLGDRPIDPVIINAIRVIAS